MLRRLVWFVGLWIAGILVVSIVAFGLRGIVGLAAHPETSPPVQDNAKT